MLSGIKKKLKKVKTALKAAVNPMKHARMIYAWMYKHARVNEKRVLFESFHGKTISDSPYHMMKEFLQDKDSRKYKIYYSSNDYKKHKEFVKRNHLPVKVIKINTFKYIWILTTAKYLINNSSFPSYFIRKENQVYLQTWHGVPLKTLGKNMKKGIESMYNVQHNFVQANYLTFPNEFTRDCIMEDYNLNALYTGKVIMSGYPRNSIFLNQEAAHQLREELGLADKTVYAYMPTWRGENSFNIQTDGYEREVKSMLAKIDEQLQEHQILFVNLHPIVSQRVSLATYKHIRTFPKDVDNYEFLNCVDALITDYSSVFFDFSITRKPIILFMYDYDDYMATRGTYFDVKELPFAKIYQLEELIDCLVSEKAKDMTYEDQSYFDRFVKYDYPEVSRKLIDCIFYGKEEGLPIEDFAHNKEVPRKVIYPKRFCSRAQLLKISEDVKDTKDVLLLEKKWFCEELNSLLYQEFNDKLIYAVILQYPVITYLEAFACYVLKNKKVRKRVILRGLQRCLPDLQVTYDYQKYV